jgi:pimeloyl-ACP methyl ester carboxylesterase
MTASFATFFHEHGSTVPALFNTHATGGHVSARPPEQPISSSTPAGSWELRERRGYFEAGRGPVVVLLHASLSSKAQWTALAQRLAGRFRAIAVDLCGYGDNGLPPGGREFSVDDEIRAVDACLEHRVDPQEPLHLVGHSYGGVVALRYAQSRPERVASLSLYEPVAFSVLDADDPALQPIGALADRAAGWIAAGKREVATRAFVDFWSGAGSYDALSPAARSAVIQRVDKVPLDFQAARTWPGDRHVLHGIDAPTLLMLGNQSPMVTQRIHAVLTRTLAHRSVGYFDCGHMGPLTDPFPINRWIESFIGLWVRRMPAPMTVPSLA